MIPDKESIRYQQPTEELPSGAVVVDVRSPDAFKEACLPNAKNLCVYEVKFLENVRSAHPDPDTPIVVYGQSADYRAADVAADRLAKAGYRNVKALAGGIDGWQSARKPVVSEAGAAQKPAPKSGRLELDTERSRVIWTGRNLINQHQGAIACKSGWIDIDSDGHPTAGEVVVDMKRISCADLSDTATNRMLIAHLSHSDFFETDTYPTATFAIDEFAWIEGASLGSPNGKASGRMTLRGKTRPVSFTALFAPIEDGYVFQTQFDLDRTEFGAVYGSGRFFERLGMHLVNDLVNLQVTAFFV